MVLMIGGNIPNQTRVLSVAIYGHVEALEFADAHRLAGGMVGFAMLVVLVALYLPRRRARGTEPCGDRATLKLPRGGFTLDVALALPGARRQRCSAPRAAADHRAAGAGRLERAAGRVTMGDEVWQDDAQRLLSCPRTGAPLGYVIQGVGVVPAPRRAAGNPTTDAPRGPAERVWNLTGGRTAGHLAA